MKGNNLMLETNKDNSLEIMDSFSIRLSNERIILFSTFNFKLMEITKCRMSLKSQYSQDYLRTQAKTIGERQFAIT